MRESATYPHDIYRAKLISLKYQARRRCWTEIYQKVDERNKKTNAKEDKSKFMRNPYTSTCFQVFL